MGGNGWAGGQCVGGWWIRKEWEPALVARRGSLANPSVTNPSVNAILNGFANDQRLTTNDGVSTTAHEIPLHQNSAMVQLMPRDDVGEPPHADFALVRDTATGPGCFVEIAQQRQRGAAHGDEVLHQIGQRTLRGRPVAHIVVLLKACERHGDGARDAQSTEGKDAFAIEWVAACVLRAPLC